MYNETGDKIKGWATFSAFGGIVKSLILGFLIIYIGVGYSELVDMPGPIYFGSIILGFYVGIAGSISAWRNYLLMAGFGELIQKTSAISVQVAELKAEQKAEQEEINQPVTTEDVSSMESDTVNLETLGECVPKWKILRQCLDQGLITEEEYEKKMQELYK